MIKLCIFDLDGTLINSLCDLAAAMNYALEHNGFQTYESEKYRLMVGSGLSVLADRAMNLKLPNEDKKQAVLSDFSEYYQSHCIDLTKPYKGISELLDKLEQNGILYAVNSNKPDSFANRIVKELFPDKSFSLVVGKRENFERKPSPDGVFEILKETGISPDNCIYVGDSNVDVYTAANAGIKFCGVSWGFRNVEELTEAGAEYIAQIPEDIFSYIIKQ